MIGEEIDMEQTKEMVDLFMSKGFTYFDSSWGYGGGKIRRSNQNCNR